MKRSKIIVGLVLIIFACYSLQGQNNKNAIIQASKWSVSVGYSMYTPADFKFESGFYPIKSKILNSYKIALDFDIIKKGNFILRTGMSVTKEPALHFDITVPAKGTPAGHLPFDPSSYAILTYSVPLNVVYNIRFKKYIFSPIIGIKAMIFPKGRTKFRGWARDSQNNPILLIHLEAQSPKNWLQGALMGGFEIKKQIKKNLFGLRVVYVHNFQNTLEGEYWIQNIENVPDSNGKYSLSGNYTTISLTFRLPKTKHFKMKKK